MSYKRTKLWSTIIVTGVCSKTDVVLVGSGITSITVTIPTNSMIAGDEIIIKRNIGATGTLTVQGQSGLIENTINTLSVTTTIGNANSTTNILLFMWDGINLLRLIN